MFHTDIKGKCGWIIWGWGAKGMLPPPPPKLFQSPRPLPTPMDNDIAHGK